MKAKILATTPKEKIVDKLSGIVRKDILAGDAAYRSVLQNLKRMAGGRVKAIEDQMHDPQFDSEEGEDPEVFLQRFRADIDRLENLRTLDDAKLYDLAAYLKGKQGQKHVFLFYQKEIMPQIEKNTLFKWLQSPTMKIMLDELFGLYSKTAHIDMERLKKTYADSSIAISFLYLTTNPNDIAPDQIVERSWDVYETFASLAEATGGLTESSSNLKSLMEKASKASENYYLLYYSPKDKSADGAFRKIEVRVKTGVYRVSHLAGYFAK